METIISVKDLRKSFRTKVKREGFGASVRSIFKPEYKDIAAVDGISLEIERGEMLAFIGPNGAGKSTTIKLLTGILYPDAGEIAVLGLRPNRDRKKLAYRIGTVFGQKSQLWFHLPPADSFRLLAAIYDLDPAAAKKRVAFLSEVFEIGELLDQPVRKLSLGERIRCEIAASLLHEPEILFLDEPSIGLDVIVKQRIRDLIQRINAEDKVTVFLTSHDAGDVEKICHRAVVINHGRVVLDDTVKRMKYSLFNRRIIDLLLEEPLSFEMPGVTVLKSKDTSAKLEVDLDAVRLEDVVNAVMAGHRVVDIAISAVPMEEIIGLIYKGAV